MSQDERRIFPREDLAAAMICNLELNGDSLLCLVKNVSVEGVLLECPGMDDSVTIDVQDRLTLHDTANTPQTLFRDVPGDVAWLYKRYVGVHFDEPVMDTPEQLRRWLEDHELV